MHGATQNKLGMAYVRLLLLVMMIIMKCVSEQIAIISPYGINRLVFRADMKCVYCVVRTDLCVLRKVFGTVTYKHVYQKRRWQQGRATS